MSVTDMTLSVHGSVCPSNGVGTETAAMHLDALLRRSEILVHLTSVSVTLAVEHIFHHVDPVVVVNGTVPKQT